VVTKNSLLNVTAKNIFLSAAFILKIYAQFKSVLVLYMSYTK